MRRVVMDVVTVGFLGGVGLIVGLSLLGDRATYHPVRFVRSLRRLLRSPIIGKDLWQELRAYNQPGFHPSDHDASELLETRRERLLRAQGARHSRRAGGGWWWPPCPPSPRHPPP